MIVPTTLSCGLLLYVMILSDIFSGVQGRQSAAHVFRPAEDVKGDGSRGFSATNTNENELLVLTPSQMPLGEVGEIILFAVPGVSSSIRCVVASSVQHGEVNAISMFGSINGDPSDGSFSLACRVSSEDSVVSCVGNIRPMGLEGHQYELRVRTFSVDSKSKEVGAARSGQHVVSKVSIDRYDRSTHYPDSRLEQTDATQTTGDSATTSHIPATFLNSRRNGNGDDRLGALANNDDNIIDVMFIFTPGASDWSGGDESAELLILLSVDESNLALKNSNVDIRVRPVYINRTTDSSYVETADGSTLLYYATDYSGAASDPSGYFDDEQALRYALKADLLVILGPVLDVCGIGFLTSGNAYYGVSVTSMDCMSGHYTMLHEIGHNVGLTHDRDNGNGGAYSFSFGYCWDNAADASCSLCRRSVMAYDGCTTVNNCSFCPKTPYLSSPTVFESGSATGTTNDDNARTFTNRGPVVAAFMASAVDGGLIQAVSPRRLSHSTCGTVEITGWRIGSGSDITSVKLAGVEVDSIISQTVDSVTVSAAIPPSPVSGGGVIVTSTSVGVSKISNSFVYDSSDSSTIGHILENFSDGPDSLFFIGEGTWQYADTTCGDSCENGGPTTGDGIFPMTRYRGANLISSFVTEMSGGDCVDTATRIAVDYFAFSEFLFCFSSEFLTLQVQTTKGGSWQTIATASTTQTSSNDTWITLSTDGSYSSVVYGVKVEVNNYDSSHVNCPYFNNVAVDNIDIVYSTSCGTACAAAPSAAPSEVFTSSHSPTVVGAVCFDIETSFV